MMCQMPRPQLRFNRTRGRREMYPIVNVLIDSESAHDSAVEDHPRRHSKPRKRTSQHECSRNPRTQREHGTRIAMMHLMQPRYERPMRMPKHPVDDVFEEGPRKQPGNENEDE